MTSASSRKTSSSSASTPAAIMARTALRRARSANWVVAQSLSSMSKNSACSAGIASSRTCARARSPPRRRRGSARRLLQPRQLVLHVGDVRADQDHEGLVLVAVTLVLEEEPDDRDL